MKNKLTYSIAALIIVIILGGFLAYGYYQKATYKLQRPIVSMEVEGYGTIKMELYPDMAPNTVNNFIKLINEGYYNGLTFHRIQESLIQGGDKQGDGTGTTEYSINGEFSKNGYKENTLSFERGTVGLARKDYSYYASMDSSLTEKGYNSGYAQFFIMAQDQKEYDGYYTAFGKVIEGMEVLDKLNETEVTTADETEGAEASKPVNPPVIKSVRVDTFGVDYGKPNTVKPFDYNSYLQQMYSGMSGM